MGDAARRQTRRDLLSTQESSQQEARAKRRQGNHGQFQRPCSRLTGNIRQEASLASAKASKSAKKDGVAEVNAPEQIKLLKAIHLEASKDPSHLFARAASSASLLVASSLYRADKGSVKKISTVYRDSQVAWVEGEVKMQAAFFVDWVNWCQSHANA